MLKTPGVRTTFGSWDVWKIAMGKRKKGPGRLSLADLGIQSRFNKDMNLNKS